MLTTLSTEQQRLMVEVRDEYLSKMFGKRMELNKVEAEKGIRSMYTLANLKQPELVIFVDSPLGLQMAVQMLRGMNIEKLSGVSIHSAVHSAVDSAVGSAVGSAVDSAVDSAVYSAVPGYTSTWSMAWDYGWCSYYDYFKRVGVVSNDGFDAYLDLLNSGVYEIIFLEGVALACPMPTVIHRTEVRGEQRLHAERGYAIEWPDGYGQHYLYGVFFDEKTFKSVTVRPSAKKVLALKNIDQRMAALRLLGAEKILKGVKAKRIHKSPKGNELYKIPSGQIDDDVYYCLKYSCPSTDRIYVSFVPAVADNDYPIEAWRGKKIGESLDADVAMAAKFSFDSKEDYLNNLVAES